MRTELRLREQQQKRSEHSVLPVGIRYISHAQDSWLHSSGLVRPRLRVWHDEPKDSTGKMRKAGVAVLPAANKTQLFFGYESFVSSAVVRITSTQL